jgi:hypothetical protein
MMVLWHGGWVRGYKLPTVKRTASYKMLHKAVELMDMVMDLQIP